MPQNKDLQKVDLPMVLKFGQKPGGKFLNNLDALDIQLIDAPTAEEARKIAWHYVKATWADKPHEIDFSWRAASDTEKSKNLLDMLQGRTLPAPMECMGFTFRLSGLSFQEVTHIIRHRAGTFAAQCTGDRDLRDDDSVIPESVENSPEFLDRWKKHVEDAKQLYADMVDSRTISMMDARTILPKSMTSFYYMRLNLRDLLMFISQRQDVQIQPETDNIIAAKMALLVCERIPEIAHVINFDKPDTHYIKTFRVQEGDKFVSRGTNLYWPEPKNDTFAYHPEDSIYQARREDLNGTAGKPQEKKFNTLWRDLTSKLRNKLFNE